MSDVEIQTQGYTFYFVSAPGTPVLLADYLNLHHGCVPTNNLSSIVVDTTAPAAAVAPDLLAASDTGTSSTDNITNDEVPRFKVTLPGDVVAGDTATLRQGGTICKQSP